MREMGRSEGREEETFSPLAVSPFSIGRISRLQNSHCFSKFLILGYYYFQLRFVSSSLSSGWVALSLDGGFIPGCSE